MALKGHIIEFLDADQLRMAYVQKEELDRLRLIDPRGRNFSVGGERVVIVHREASEEEFPGIARQIAEHVAARRLEVDVELLWQSLAGTGRELEPGELAKMFFAEDSPEAASAVFRAVSDHSLFFKRKGMRFLRKTEEQVAAETARLARQREREQARQQVQTLLSDLVRNRDAAITTDAQPVIERIQNWLRHKTADQVGTILEEVAGPAKARDVAYDLLVRAGRVDASADRFLVTAGIEPSFGPQLIEAAGNLARYAHDPARADLRQITAIALDDEDTREVDDALTLTRTSEETIVGVHIADVSAFVAKGSLLDIEASRRSSTVYLPAATAFMFPEHLSTDLASLREGVERPAFTVEIRFDRQGNRIGYRILTSSIVVQKRLSYDQADHALERGDKFLETMRWLAAKLQQSRAERGAITFRRPELKVRI